MQLIDKVAKKLYDANKAGRSQAELAQKIGISQTNISHLASGNYKRVDVTISDEIINQVAEWLIVAGLATRADFFGDAEALYAGWAHLETPVFRAIAAEVALAVERKEVRVVDGPVGMGKTYALEHLSRTLPGKIIYIKIHSEYGKLDILHVILAALGEKVERLSPAAAMLRITEKLTNLKATLVLDELEYMKKPVWHTVKALIDETKRGRTRTCGIVLSGYGIHANLKRWAGANYGPNGYEQLYSRLTGKFVLLSKPNGDEWKKEVRDICQTFGLEPDCGDLLAKWAGNYRDLEGYLTAAELEAAAQSEKISVDFLRKTFA
jgi:DNA transposition AAA+ family ATPase